MQYKLQFGGLARVKYSSRAKELGLSFADVRIGDGQDLPYDDDRFDGSFSIHALIFFADRAAGFRELRRVKRPGCRSVVSSMASLSSQFKVAVESISEELRDLQLPQGGPPLNSTDSFSREMAPAGFRQVTIHIIEYAEYLPSVFDFWEKMQKAAAPFIVLKAKLGKRRWAEVSDKVLKRLEQALGDGPVDEVYTTHLGVDVK